MIRRAASVSGLAATVATVRSLPRLDATFGDTPSGDELRSWFTDKAWRVPVSSMAVAVLPVPSDYADYVRGRHRQALRTNVRRAEAAGARCAEVADASERERCVRHVLGSRSSDSRNLLADPARTGVERLVSTVYDAEGVPLAFSEIVVDGPWAGLGCFVTSLIGDASRDARYQLHAYNVRALIARQVTYLAVGGSILLASPGTRYFQCRTGFEPVALRLKRPASVGRAR